MIYLLRHGKTTWNKEGRLQGSSHQEGVLLEESLLEIDRISHALKDITFDAFYVSPLRRAKDSFHRLSVQLSTPPIFDDRLKELDFGIYDGHVYHALDPEILQEREDNPMDFRWEGGESYRDADMRARAFIEDVRLRSRNGQNIGIVAHQIINICLLYNLTLRSEFLDFRQQHTEIVQIAQDGVFIQSV